MNDVRRRREQLGLSQQALADWCHVGLRAVSNLESRAEPGDAGGGHSPSADRIRAALTEIEKDPGLLRGLDGPGHWFTL